MDINAQFEIEERQADITLFLNYYCGGNDLLATDARLDAVSRELKLYEPTIVERMGIV